jgi:hypothetical protein
VLSACFMCASLGFHPQNPPQKKKTQNNTVESPLCHHCHRNCEILPLQLLVKNIQLEDGKMVPASHFFRGADSSALELTEAELATAEAVRVRGTFRGAAQLGRLCTVHLLGESYSLELALCAGLRDGISSVLSWSFLMSQCPPFLCR